MLSIVTSAALICLGSLAVGQGLLALCGARRWSWLAPPVGVAALILLAVPALHVPGRAATAAVAMLLATLCGIVLWARRPEHRPPLDGVVAAIPVALLVLVPFIASGRAGTLGVSFANDMAGRPP